MSEVYASPAGAPSAADAGRGIQGADGGGNTRGGGRGGEPRGLWSDAWRRLRDNRAVLLALGLIVLIAVVAVCGPALSPYAADTLDWQHLAIGPGTVASHWFGTDRLG